MSKNTSKRFVGKKPEFHLANEKNLELFVSNGISPYDFEQIKKVMEKFGMIYKKGTGYTWKGESSGKQ